MQLWSCIIDTLRIIQFQTANAAIGKIYSFADDDEINPAAISTTKSNAMIVDLIPGNINQMFLGAEVLPILNTFGCVSK